MHKTKTAAIFLFFLILSVSFLYPDTQKVTLTYFKGEVSVFRKQTLAYTEINMRIYPGDSIVTADESSAEITYEDGSVSSILPNSILKIGQLKREQGLFTTRLKTWVGSILCKVTKLRKGDSFRVFTPTAVATVRGTVFEVAVNEKQETSFNVLSGELLAKALIKDAKAYLLKGQFKYFVGAEGIPDVRKLTEQEIKNLEERATMYIRDYIQEKQKEIEKGIKKQMKKGCLGFL
ncbi:MAG: hypothetical protein E3J78_02795 [Candidatus Cloacimonadota bacterium]|nr:MAG: hypothetical protein E3J78_02795 [Candidatus Cloacimonadota bacterium]